MSYIQPYYEDSFATIYHGDCREILPYIKNIDLCVTSPPYNCGKEYENELSNDSYTKLLQESINCIYHALRDGGRFVLNLPPNMKLGDKWIPNLQLGFVVLYNSKFLLKDVIVWDQQYADCETAWGSWLSASAPSIRHQNEYLIICYRGDWGHGRGKTEINPKEFMTFTKDSWKIKPATRSNIHPALFPEELPQRCIQLFSFSNGIILDPFMGAGTTLRVAKNMGRKSIGIEIKEEYCEKAARRLAQEILPFGSSK